MASTQTLNAATQDRKSRLAQLKSLKRKQPEDHQTDGGSAVKSPRHDASTAEDEANIEGKTPEDTASKYLSGRNYDTATKGAKLGFESGPSDSHETLEKKAAALAIEAKRQTEEEEKADKPLDLFKLQPKKPNWDLKRDLDRKLEVLNVRTENAIARLVRERISNQQRAARAKGGAQGTDGESEVVGMEGASLVEATKLREREDEEELRRERHEEEEDDNTAVLDGS